MMNATTTSDEVTVTASCTPGRPMRLASIASTSESGGSSRGLIAPLRGSSSQAPSTSASRASLVRMICERVMGSRSRGG